LVTDSTPSSVTAGGGVFIAHVCGLNVLVDQYGCFGWSGDQAAIEKLVHHPETKNPAGFQAGRVLEISMICVRS
jgi:hypothetical protein